MDPVISIIDFFFRLITHVGMEPLRKKKANLPHLGRAYFRLQVIQIPT
jgi:hypothetical protein